jgi:predicted GNAT family N-acyltransferase
MAFVVMRFASDDPQMAAARAIRDAVFCREQGVSPALEWDGKDDACVHYLLRDGDEPIATARTRPLDSRTWKIERVAVTRAQRSRGVGRAIMGAILDVLDRAGCASLLHSQTAVAGFYERLGYRREGEEFVEAGIAHVAMRRPAPLPGSQAARSGLAAG